MNENLFLLINPPNSNLVLKNRPLVCADPVEHSDYAAYAATGLVTIATALCRSGVQAVYMDGSVMPYRAIQDFIDTNASNIAAVGISALTANYEAGLALVQRAKRNNSRIAGIVGNDHFSSLAEICLDRQREILDFGFVGDDVVDSVVNLATQLTKSAVIDTRIPGIAWREGATTRMRAPKAESLPNSIDYSLIDTVYPHTKAYATNFSRGIAPRIKELFGRLVSAGVTLNIARGCVKLISGSACSFCSIHHGAARKEAVSPTAAWDALRSAWDSGYDYFYVTADELPITFNRLLKGMRSQQPSWWSSLPKDSRPMLTGYACAEALCREDNVRLLSDLGFRILAVGFDASVPISLLAINKPLIRDSDLHQAQRLIRSHKTSIANANRHGLKIRAGFVLGHIGMNVDLLDENVARFINLMEDLPEAIAAVDVEILVPEPGSRDFEYLTSPSAAEHRAKGLGLEVAPLPTREEIASRWTHEDRLPPDELVADYCRALMPGILPSHLQKAKHSIRTSAEALGITVGGGAG